MRTAHIIRRFTFSEWGGTECVVWNTARMLQSKGNPSEIFATNALSAVSGDEEKQNIKIHRLPYHYPNFPISAEKKRILDKKGGNPVVPRLKKSLVDGCFDLLHCHNLGRMAVTVRAASKKAHIPYILSLHGGFFDVPAREIQQMMKPLRGTIPYGGILDQLLLRRCDPLKDASGILCVGQTEYEKAKEKFPNKPLILLPNGVDYEHFHMNDGTDFRRKAGVPAGRKIILCVARIDYQKNQLILPEILALLGEPWHLVIIGAPTAEWYMSKLRDKIRLMGLTECVTLITGVPPESPLLPEAYHAASAMLLPSLHEPFGIVVLEAWSAGTPVIAAPSGGLKTLIREGENGFFAPPEGAPEQWADLVRRLDSEPDFREPVVAAADREVNEKYSWQVVTEKLLDFYREVQRIYRRR